jgi:diacylglycerol kinase (ATP)
MFQKNINLKMARVKLLHNAKAGDESHSERKLISMIESKGFICDYSSIKADEYDIPDETDFIVIAGGDGTVKKTAKKLFERKLIDKQFPLAILPLGTANNLSKSLNIDLDPETTIDSWKKPHIKKFDVGRIYGMGKVNFFLEGMGYGIFPYLIHKMKAVDEELADDPEKKTEEALKILHKITLSYKTQYAHIVIDGQDHSGNYLMLEIMNIPSIGPNLLLAPEADSGDGFFEVILIPEEKRKQLAGYIESKLKGKEITLDLQPIKGKQIYVKWQGQDGHIDDKLVRLKDHPELKIENHKGLLEFYK